MNLAEAADVLLDQFNLCCHVCDGEDTIKQGLGTELDSPGDELGLRVGHERGHERIIAVLPDVTAVKPEPNQSVNTETVFPSRLDDGVAKEQTSGQ